MPSSTASFTGARTAHTVTITATQNRSPTEASTSSTPAPIRRATITMPPQSRFRRLALASLIVSGESRISAGLPKCVTAGDVLRSPPRSFHHVLHLATVPGNRPDHQEIQHDDENRPERVVRDGQEVRHCAHKCDADRDDSRPHLAEEEEDSRACHHDSEEHMDPAPGRGIDLK